MAPFFGVKMDDEYDDLIWRTVQKIDLKPTQGIELKTIETAGEPGALFRIKTITVAGPSYDAIVWSFKSNGIKKKHPLAGYDFGGDEVKSVLVQWAITKGEVELIHQLHGE